MKNRIQKKSYRAKLVVFAGLFMSASAFTASAQSAFAVFLKTDNYRQTFSIEDSFKAEVKRNQMYIIWNIENDTYRAIYLNVDTGEYSLGSDREWKLNKSVVDRGTGQKQSILSEFDFVGQNGGDIYSGYMKGVKKNRVIENGQNPRQASIAKVYRGWGHDQWSLNQDIKQRYWRVHEFHMKYLDGYTRSVNDKKFDKLEDAQRFVAEIIEGEGGWREAR